MFFAFVEDGVITAYPIGQADIRRRFPETSFPKPLEGVDLSNYGVVTVVDTEQPAINTETQKIEEGTPVLVDGVWEQTWNVIDFSAAELQEIADQKAASARSERNQRLKNTDWTQVADTPVSSADWAVYRQALRDVPAQAGFPDSITWPTEPS